MTTPPPTPSSVLVPLYVHPAVDPEAWRQLTDSPQDIYGVVLNTADGPGSSPDPAFVTAARELRDAGIRVLGYVDSNYGSRPAAEAAEDLARHRAWYAVDGCFLDRVGPGRSALGGCRRLVRELRGQGADTVVLNPGVHPTPGYARIADLLVTFEGHWSTYLEPFDPPAWTRRYPVQRFCHLVYGVPPALSSLAATTARERGAGVHCAVPGSGPNPWTVPPRLRDTGGT